MPNKLLNRQKPPIFDIPASVWRTVSFLEIEETFNDMLDAGLINPPFFHFFVRVPFGAFVQATRDYAVKSGEKLPDLEGFPDWIKKAAEKPLVVEYEFKKKDPPDAKGDLHYRSRSFLGEGKEALPWSLVTGMPDHMSDAMDGFIYKALVALLVTKNCDRKVVENTPRAKSAKAREDAKSYSTTTYISIGRITETYRSEGGSRGPVRAHLRRGHVRKQRFGEGRKEVKTIFIPPVFVNADREWIADRKKYKLVA